MAFAFPFQLPFPASFQTAIFFYLFLSIASSAIGKPSTGLGNPWLLTYGFLCYTPYLSVVLPLPDDPPSAPTRPFESQYCRESSGCIKHHRYGDRVFHIPVIQSLGFRTWPAKTFSIETAPLRLYTNCLLLHTCLLLQH